MGTNYYARENACKHCGHSKVQVHIGKSSVGWTFSFNALDDIKSAKEWFMYLDQKDVKIFDEYDREVSLDELKDLINFKKKEKWNHVKKHPEDGFLDKEGNSFTKGEFS